MARKAQWKLQVKHITRVNRRIHEQRDKGERHYRFTLQIGPVFINGLIYQRNTGAIISPQFKVQGWRKANVVRFVGGIHAVRIREMVEAELVKREAFRRQEFERSMEMSDDATVQQFPGEARTEGTKLGSESPILPEPAAPSPPSPS